MSLFPKKPDLLKIAAEESFCTGQEHPLTDVRPTPEQRQRQTLDAEKLRREQETNRGAAGAERLFWGN